MHPALSIVFFTTASGAGFALLLLLGLGVPLGLLPPSAGSALPRSRSRSLLAAGGLASSVFHLGRPERAWRAFSQWRSSWLSREGVFSVLTFVPAAIFGIGWVFFGATGGLGRSLRHPRRGAGGGDDLLHRHDLRVAEADPSMAQPLGRAELFRARADERVAGSRFSRPALGAARAGRGSLGLRSLVIARLVAQGSILALDRHDLGAEHRRQRDLARQPRQGAHARAAAHRGELPAEGDGFSRSPASTASGCARSRGSPLSRLPASADACSRCWSAA